MTKLRAALIGCGFFAMNHANAWQELDGVEIVAICDTDQNRLTHMGNTFGVERRYTDATELFREGGFDFVDIATTVASHAYLVSLAAANGVRIICQKPFATSFTEGQRLVRICREAGVKLMVHENFRWQAPIRHISRAIAEGAIGKPFWGRFSFRTGYDIYANQPYLAHGERFIIEDLGVHILDIARFLMGSVNSLTACTNKANPAIRAEDVATMLLRHDNGATSVVDVSYATKLATDPFPQTLVEIDGEDGSLRLLPGYKLQITGKAGVKELDVSPELHRWASPPWHNVQESVYSIQSHWLDSLRNGTPIETSGEDNLQTLALVEAAYESARLGQTISLGTPA